MVLTSSHTSDSGGGVRCYSLKRETIDFVAEIATRAIRGRRYCGSETVHEVREDVYVGGKVLTLWI